MPLSRDELLRNLANATRGDDFAANAAHLVSLSRDYPATREQLLKAGALDILLSGMRRITHSEAAQLAGVIALEVLAAHGSGDGRGRAHHGAQHHGPSTARVAIDSGAVNACLNAMTLFPNSAQARSPPPPSFPSLLA